MKRYVLILVLSLLTAMTSQAIGQDETKRKRCEAIAKSTKMQCKNLAQPGKTVCKVHDKTFMCGAMTSKGQPCRNPVADKTEKTPEKRCWRHG